MTIKNERMKQIFIDSAKTIIKEKGLKFVSAREISKISGYSYTTLYNYFENIDSLLTYVAVDYLEESYQEMLQALKGTNDIKKKIIVASKTYFSFMYNHPSIFKIVFINDFGVEVESMSYKLIPKVTILLRELLKDLKDRQITLDRDILFELISSSIHSKLMFAIFKRSPIKYDDLLMMIERELNILIGDIK